jgi:hypothetical protein
MNKSASMIGKVFGRLTVVSVSDKDKDGHSFWNCICICGGEKRVRGYSLRRGDTRSCGCIMAENAWDHPRKHATPEVAAWLFNYRQYLRNAKHCGHEVTLSFDEYKFLASQPCAYCGEPPEKRPSQRGRASVFASGIDRVDNSKGYTKENVVPCCTWCNRAKNNTTKEEFIKKCKMVAANAGIARHG